VRWSRPFPRHVLQAYLPAPLNTPPLHAARPYLLRAFFIANPPPSLLQTGLLRPHRQQLFLFFSVPSSNSWYHLIESGFRPFSRRRRFLRYRTFSPQCVDSGFPRTSCNPFARMTPGPLVANPPLKPLSSFFRASEAFFPRIERLQAPVLDGFFSRMRPLVPDSARSRWQASFFFSFSCSSKNAADNPKYFSSWISDLLGTQLKLAPPTGPFTFFFFCPRTFRRRLWCDLVHYASSDTRRKITVGEDFIACSILNSLSPWKTVLGKVELPMVYRDGPSPLSVIPGYPITSRPHTSDGPRWAVGETANLDSPHTFPAPGWVIFWLPLSHSRLSFLPLFECMVCAHVF